VCLYACESERERGGELHRRWSCSSSSSSSRQHATRRRVMGLGPDREQPMIERCTCNPYCRSNTSWKYTLFPSRVAVRACRKFRTHSAAPSVASMPLHIFLSEIECLLQAIEGVIGLCRGRHFCSRLHDLAVLALQISVSLQSPGFQHSRSDEDSIITSLFAK
jgi:hypothetical protein